jgi:hypothetical protein
MRVRSRSKLAWSLTAAGLFASHVAAAQDINLTAKAAANEPGAEHARGTYMGVKPGGDQAPSVKVKPGPQPAAVTWPGFQMQPDGSSRVFIQTTVPVDPGVQPGNRKVVVDLGNAQIVGHTNKLPLYTQYFNTPVTSVELKRDKKHKRTHLVITLRADVSPRVSSEVAHSGFNFVYFDFPAGQYLDAATVAAAPGTPPPVAAAQANASVLNQPPPAPTTLEGEVNAHGNVQTRGSQADAAMNAELPPGMGQTKSTAKAGGGVSFGKKK